MQLILAGVLVIVSIAVIFALQNAAAVGVTFLVWHFQMSLALLLLITFVLGVLASFLASLSSVLRRNSVIASQQKTIRELESTMAEDKELLKPSEFVN